MSDHPPPRIDIPCPLPLDARGRMLLAREAGGRFEASPGYGLSARDRLRPTIQRPAGVRVAILGGGGLELVLDRGAA